jgi:hypothetical protein
METTALLNTAASAISKSWEFSIVTGVQMVVIAVEFFFILMIFRVLLSELKKRDEREKRELEIREKEVFAKENLAISLTKLAERVGGFKCSNIQKMN